MRPRYAVLFEPRAVREMDEARRWWAEHRGTRALDDAIAGTLDRLELLPWSAPRVQIRGKWSTTRRAALGRTGYQLFYRPNVGRDALTVVAIWHERRPSLRL